MLIGFVTFIFLIYVSIIFKKLYLKHKKLNQTTTYILYTDFSTAFLNSFWLQDTIQNISRITEPSFIDKKKGYICLSREREKKSIAVF